MKHVNAFSIALFLGSMTLLAQSSGRDATQPTIAHVAQVSLDCPIDMQAQRQPGQGTPAFSGSRNKGVAQKLHLTLNNPKFAEIVGIQITAHGFDSKVRVSPAQTVQTDSTEITKVLHLKLRIVGKSETSTDLLLPAFTSVRSIDLDSVSYADGSTWRSSALHTCHIIPDGSMLISSR